MAGNGASTMLELALSFERADPNIPDNEGNTPLHFAAQAGKRSLFMSLKKKYLFFYDDRQRVEKISICHAEIFQGQRCSPCSNFSTCVLRVIERIRPRGGYKFYKHFSR